MTKRILGQNINFFKLKTLNKLYIYKVGFWGFGVDVDLELLQSTELACFVTLICLRFITEKKKAQTSCQESQTRRD
jgi:hypothetical protein